MNAGRQNLSSGSLIFFKQFLRRIWWRFFGSWINVMVFQILDDFLVFWILGDFLGFQGIGIMLFKGLGGCFLRIRILTFKGLGGLLSDIGLFWFQF
jgi:hypothetical protein